MSSATAITCPACQKSYPWKSHLAGKKVRCACGQVIQVAAIPQDGDLLDLAPEPAAQPAAPKVDRSNLQDVIRNRMGIIPGKTSETKERERLDAHRAEMEEKLKPNILRDSIIPIIVIAIGVALLFVEQTSYTKHPSASMAAAIPMVIGRALLATGLIACGMFLARAMLDVTFVHSIKDSAIRIIAIAIGPCAIYGICSASMGDLAGPFLGSVISLASYSILFWYLLQLDARDVSVCVLITWILVAMSNYAAFRAEAYYSDPWI